MNNIQGFGNFTLGAGGSKTLTIRQNVLTHIIVATALTDLLIEVDYFGKNNIKLIEEVNILKVQDIAYPSKRFPATIETANFAVPVGHIHLASDVLEVTVSSATGGAVAVATAELFVGNDYLVRCGTSSGSSKVYNNLRTARKVISDDIGEARIFEEDKKIVLDNTEVNAVGSIYAPNNSTADAIFFVRPNPEANQITIEYTDTTKYVYYSQYIFDSDLVSYSQKANANRFKKFIQDQGKDLATVKKVQKAV